MPMKNIQDLVREFHAKYNFECPSHPRLPNLQTALNRVRLIQEELTELAQAYLDLDLVKIADALGDLNYLVNGGAVEVGIDLDAVTREIARSNMTKNHSAEYYGKPVKGLEYTPPELVGIVWKRDLGKAEVIN